MVDYISYLSDLHKSPQNSFLCSTESVKAIAETFEVAVQMIGCEVQLVTGKLEKKRGRGRNQLANFLNPLSSLTRSSPDTLKTAGIYLYVLYVCISVCVCIYVCVYVCMYVCIYVCTVCIYAC